jgi:hypothetical protein
VSDPERASTTTARSTHIAVIGAVAWRDIAARLSPALARVDAEATNAQCLVLVPTPSDVVDLANELNLHLAPRAIRVAPLATPRLARRLVGVAHAQVLVATPEGATALIGASALALSDLAGIGICAADEMEEAGTALDQVLAEVGKGATKVLTAAKVTPYVERVLEGHMHGARRVTATIEPAGITLPQVEIVAVTSGAPLAPLGDVLESADAPSAGILPADTRRADAARETLLRLGHGPDSPLARIVEPGTASRNSLLVLAGAPSHEVIAAACAAAPPARVVALVTARERASLAATLVGSRIVPFALAAARSDALTHETQLRDRIRAMLGDGLPAREMLALEPLLADADPLAVAGALLRMYERERDTLRRMRESKIEADTRPRPAADRAPREDRPPRRDDGDRPPRSRDDRPPRRDDGDRPPRKFDRERSGDDRPPRKFDRDKPRSFDRDKPRSFDRDKPRSFDRGPRKFDRERPRPGARDDRGPRRRPPER